MITPYSAVLGLNEMLRCKKFIDVFLVFPDHIAMNITTQMCLRSCPHTNVVATTLRPGFNLEMELIWWDRSLFWRRFVKRRTRIKSLKKILATSVGDSCSVASTARYEVSSMVNYDSEVTRNVALVEENGIHHKIDGDHCPRDKDIRSSTRASVNSWRVQDSANCVINVDAPTYFG